MLQIAERGNELEAKGPGAQAHDTVMRGVRSGNNAIGGLGAGLNQTDRLMDSIRGIQGMVPDITAQKARGGDAFEVVAISIDSDEDVDYAKRRLTELGAASIAFRHAPLDRGDIVYGANVQGFPTTILYGPDGIELARMSGEADWAASEAVQFIDAALRQARKR